jgi:hypothetical protein
MPVVCAATDPATSVTSAAASSSARAFLLIVNLSSEVVRLRSTFNVDYEIVAREPGGPREASGT